MDEVWLSSVHVLDDDDSLESDITFQSAKKGISMNRLLQLMHEDLREQAMEASCPKEGRCGNTRVPLSQYYPRRKTAPPRQNRQGMQSFHNSQPSTITRRCTMPPASTQSNQSSSDIIEMNAIIELKLQVAQQMETIDRLSSDLKDARSEKDALLSKVKPPPKSVFKIASLVEEKAHSDNTKSLHQQYNELQDKMNKMQKSMELQKEQMTALEADNKRLTKERNSFQVQFDRMSYTSVKKLSSLSITDHLRDSEYTANTTVSSGLSEHELTPTNDRTNNSYHHSNFRVGETELIEEWNMQVLNRRRSA